MVMPSKCIVLDIETIPDQKVCLDKKEFDFPLPIFHKLASLSYAVLNNSFELEDFQVLGLDEESEEASLRAFGALVEKDTMVVTWSGRRFDIPVILYRSMVYGISCKWHFQPDFDKRFGLTGHVDLQDHMTLFGATDKLRLEHVAVTLGLPGKVGVKGSDVQELWAKNRFHAIGSYNASDVVETTVVFLRWAHLRGLATKQEVNHALERIACFPSTAYLKGSDISKKSVTDGTKLVVENCNWKSLMI
jgi:predicted PolB exonuclease-like 3'-5' exonuclease